MDLEPIHFKISPNTPADDFKAHIRENVKRSLPRLAVKQCAIVAGGPSVEDHLAEIRRAWLEGFDIFAINGAVRFLIERGISPTYGILYDARADNADFIYPNSDTHWLVASHCHPSVFEKLEELDSSVTVFHSSGQEGVAELVRELEPKATIFEGTSTGGLQALSLVTMMGYKVARLYGYDSSAREHRFAFRDGSSAWAKHAYAQPLNADQPLLEIFFNDKVYQTSAVMAEQAKLFAETYPMYEGVGLNITVIGDGLLPDMWRHSEANKGPITGETTEELEAAKYQHIWTKDTYRRYSPGEMLLDDFIQEMRPSSGARIVDFGCGPGRATAKLASMGFDVLGVDHAANCLDVGVTVPLCIANLWHLPETVKGHYGLCCDVMEHIPPHHVEQTLRRIAAAVSLGCFFNISFVPDRHGDRRTGPLHLTVKPAEWWAEKLSAHFPKVQHNGGGMFACFK